MNNRISCIVPFFNEVPRIYTTLEILSQSHDLAEIIAVNDGSTDNPEIDIKKYSIPVNLIKIDTNHGKSAAVFEGIDATSGNLILLVDADFKGLNIEEIDNACRLMLEHPDVDMLILRSTQGTWITRACRQDIVLSGFRLMKKKDLLNVYIKNPRRYQLETAVNAYMIEHNKKVFYTEFTGYNTLRNEKIGLLRGFIGLLYLLADVYSYRGYVAYIKQLWTFCYDEIETR